jgi:hypothetical protein
MENLNAIYFDVHGVVCKGRADPQNLSTVDFHAIQTLIELCVKSQSWLVLLSTGLRLWEDEICLDFLEKIGLKTRLFMPTWKAPLFTRKGERINSVRKGEVIDRYIIAEFEKPRETATHCRENGIVRYAAVDDKNFTAADVHGKFVQVPFGLNSTAADEVLGVFGRRSPKRPDLFTRSNPANTAIRSAITSDFRLPAQNL